MEFDNSCHDSKMNADNERCPFKMSEWDANAMVECKLQPTWCIAWTFKVLVNERSQQHESPVCSSENAL